MKELSNCEKMVLSCIYNYNGTPNVHDIESLLLKEYNKKYALQTLCTFLKRIESKGYSKAEKKGRYTYYMPTISYEDYLKIEIKNVASLYFYDDIDALKHYINLTF